MNLVVDDYTTPLLFFINPQTSFNDAKLLMQKENIRHLPVLDGESVVGIISDRDVKLIESVFEETEKLSVDVAMTPDPYTVDSNTPLKEVAYYMSANKIGSAIVNDVNDNQYGIFTSTDALNALLEVLDD